MSRTINEIRSLARSHTRTAINVLVGVMRSKDATHTARVSAANAILDRGWGKAPQSLETAKDGALELIHRIERVIVHPENTDSERRLSRCSGPPGTRGSTGGEARANRISSASF